MGTIKKISPVKYILGMISSDESLFRTAMEAFCIQFGDFDIISETIPFDFTDYYKDEMGECLLRKFASVAKLMDPGLLPDIKIYSNKIEKDLGIIKEGEFRRRINLDPGYVSLSKLVLASTKDFRHRIYLRDGIFAEITLYWQKKQFCHWDWTFPDYRTELYKNYFTKVRETYYRQLQDLRIEY